MSLSPPISLNGRRTLSSFGHPIRLRDMDRERQGQRERERKRDRQTQTQTQRETHSFHSILYFRLRIMVVP